MATDGKREVRVRVLVNQTWFDVDDVGKRTRVRDEEGMSDERREHGPAPGRSPGPGQPRSSALGRWPPEPFDQPRSSGLGRWPPEPFDQSGR